MLHNLLRLAVARRVSQFVFACTFGLMACAGDLSKNDNLAPVIRFGAIPRTPNGHVLSRQSIGESAVWRALVVPGSGCESLTTSAERLVHGLAHAQVLILQKPGLSNRDVACRNEFIEWDNLADWQLAANELSKALLTHTDSRLPLVIVGMSEGAELIPGLVRIWPETSLIVMVSHPGLDPLEAGELQASRLGQAEAWASLIALSKGGNADGHRMQGRSAKYWRSLSSWQLQSTLLAESRPLLHVWAESDELIPAVAYERFGNSARIRRGPYCDVRFVGVNHELRNASRDRLQEIWQWLDTAIVSSPSASEIWLKGCKSWQARAGTLD